jgi:gliding motility-associated lipoprotein GldH
MKNLLITIILISTLIACESGNRVFNSHQDLSPKLEWLKADFKEFKVPIEDNTILYNMSLSFRYISGYPYQTANVKVTETSPNGEVTIEEYKLTVIDSKGDYIGEAGYGIFDSEHLIKANKKYTETGTYTYLIEQNSPVDPLTSVMEIGIALDKAGE